MVEEFQSGREVGLALEAFRTSIDGQRDQLILMKWVIGGSSAIAVAIFAYLYAVTTQTLITTARIESRFDVVDEHFKGAAERSDAQFKVVNEQFKGAAERSEVQFKVVNEQFKTVNEQFKTVNEQFKAVDQRFNMLDQRLDERFRTVDDRFKAVDERFNAVDQRFDTLEKTMDQRFDDMGKRLDYLTTLVSNLLPPKQKTEGFTLAPRLKNAL